MTLDVAFPSDATNTNQQFYTTEVYHTVSPLNNTLLGMEHSQSPVSQFGHSSPMVPNSSPVMQYSLMASAPTMDQNPCSACGFIGHGPSCYENLNTSLHTSVYFDQNSHQFEVAHADASQPRLFPDHWSPQMSVYNTAPEPNHGQGFSNMNSAYSGRNFIPVPSVPAPLTPSIPPAAPRLHTIGLVSTEQGNGIPFTSPLGTSTGPPKKGRVIIPCMFEPFNCKQTFTSKNEWKRHIETFHIQRTYFRCPMPKDGTRRAVPCDSIFNRKDLLMQHMHRHWRKSKPLSALYCKCNSQSQHAANKTSCAKQAVQELANASCMERFTHMPTMLKCPAAACAHEVFTGADAWAKKVEHTFSHFEKGDTEIGIGCKYKDAEFYVFVRYIGAAKVDENNNYTCKPPCLTTNQRRRGVSKAVAAGPAELSASQRRARQRDIRRCA